MQRLTYINLLGGRLELCLKPYLLASLKGLLAGELDVSALRGACQQGDTAVGYRRPPRRVEATISIVAESRAQLYALRSEAQRILSPDAALSGRDRAKLYYENDAGLWWTWAVPEQLESGKRVCNAETGMRLTFRCESPYWYSGRQGAETFSYSGDGFSLPFDFPIAFGTMDCSKTLFSGGHVRAYPEVWVYGRGETPALRNASTGAVLALRAPLPQGSVMRCNTDPARLEATITDAQGQVTNAFCQLDIAHPLTEFWLRPGLNQLIYEPTGASTQSVITIKWYDAFEGV